MEFGAGEPWNGAEAFGGDEVQRSGFRLDLEDERLWHGDRPVQISNKAFLLLRLFVENPDRLLTKEQILQGVWGDVWVSEGLVKEYVHDLRLALGDDPRSPLFIETVHGRGYRFLGGVRQVDRPKGGALLTERATPVAVLAFANLADSAEPNYLADAISEDIIIGLSKNPHLSVISRNSSFAFKGKPAPVRRIAEELGAQFVVEGSVRKAGQRIRITAKLIDAASDRHLWAETYDLDLDDVFAVQDEVVGSITHALGATDGVIERSAWQQIAAASHTHPTAYACYLQAREHLYRHGDSGFDEAEALYEKAIELDQGFARAYSGLAMLHFLRSKKYFAVPFKSVEEKTLNLALQAVQMNPNDYMAHWVLGRVYGYQGKHMQSFAEFERAIRMNPSDANVLAVWAEQLVYCGRLTEAVEVCKRSIRLNPNCPDWYWWNLGFSYFHLGLYKDALVSIQRMSSLGHARRLLTALYAHLSRLADARSEAEAYMKLTPNFSIGEWARTEPYADPNELQRYVDGLRKAGLPE